MNDDDQAAMHHQQELERQEQEEMNLTTRLAEIQQKLNAPKNQLNKFGGYHYRSCEDILTAVKPLLHGLVLTISDEIVPVNDRVYVKATATITDGIASITATAFARESETRKGMDDSQITGSTSSYARKYALNGLLLIDDNKDADHEQKQVKPAITDDRLSKAIETILSGSYKREDLINKFALTPKQLAMLDDALAQPA